MGHWLNMARELSDSPAVSANSANSPELGEQSLPIGTNGSIGKDAMIIAWINSNPPELPKHQNHCAACGDFVEVHDTSWVVLGDGAFIHYGGKHGDVCWKKWRDTRRLLAIAALKGV